MKALYAGIIGSIVLLSLYFIIMISLNSLDQAMQQFVSVWYFNIVLAIGFGVQVGLYFYVKDFANNMLMTTQIAATGGVSSASMLACCVHRIIDVLPIIGLSGAAIFLSQYQMPFLVLGIFSNFSGIVIMLNIMQRHKLFNKKGMFKLIMKYNMNIIRNVIIAISIVVVTFAFASASFLNNWATTKISLSEQINDENGVSIKVLPLSFSANDYVKFSIRLDTHIGSLDHDLTKISVLEDNKGNKYLPLSWEGSPPGGHHRTGTLTFSAIKDGATSMRLVIKDVYDVPERVFSWNW